MRPFSNASSYELEVYEPESIRAFALVSMSRVVSGSAGPPQAGLNLRPLHSGGLCEAETTSVSLIALTRIVI